MNIENLSIIELKQLLARVNHDLKMNKPTIKRAKKIAALTTESEYITCNNIAAKFTNKQYDKPIENKKIKQDIQIQQDILEFLNSGNHIITARPRKSRKFTNVVSYSNRKIISL